MGISTGINQRGFYLGYKPNTAAPSITVAYNVPDPDNGNFQQMYNAFRNRWGEEFTPTSALIGKKIVGIRFILKSFGSPTGIMTAKIFDQTDTLKATMGTIDASLVPTNPTSYDLFGDSYTIPAAETTRIFIEYTGGDVSNFIYVNTAFPDGFDGANTILGWFENYGTGGTPFDWNSSDDEDLAGVIWVQ